MEDEFFVETAVEWGDHFEQDLIGYLANDKDVAMHTRQYMNMMKREIMKCTKWAKSTEKHEINRLNINERKINGVFFQIQILFTFWIILIK